MATPQITEGMKRDALLRILHNKTYFEKTIAASNAPDYTKHCTLAIPVWFVIEHGDKFRQSVLLWSGSRKEPWRVELHLSYRRPCSRPEAKVDGGWRAFAAANGLTVGDSLLFCVRAMSEFDVYVFRSLIPVQAPPAENVLGCRERSEASFQDRSIGEGVSGGEGAGGGVDAPLHGWKGNISFEKTLPAGAVSARFQLTFPATFVHQHGDKIRERVVLQSVEDRRTWTVNVKVSFPRRQLQVTICGGAWKPFAVSHGLVEGDRLWFTLVAMSKFEVLVIRSGGIPKDVRLCVQRPVKRFKREDPEFSQSDWHPPKLLESQHRNLACESNVKLERESSSELFAQKGAAEICVGTYSTFGSLPSSSGTDSDNFERTKRTLLNLGPFSDAEIQLMREVKPIPKAFVRQHGDKIRKHAVLQSVEDRKTWAVKVMAHVPCQYLQVTIWGGNWKEFVVYNGLVEGDRLTFTLMAISMFEVLINRSGGSVKTIKKSKYESTFSQTRNSNVKLENEWSSELFAEKGAVEDSVGTYSGSASSQSPSDMDSNKFERQASHSQLFNTGRTQVQM